MYWFASGFIFWLLETWCFGFNMEPCCIAERICDAIAGGLMLYGLVKTVVIFEAKKLIKAACGKLGDK